MPWHTYGTQRTTLSLFPLRWHLSQAWSPPVWLEWPASQPAPPPASTSPALGLWVPTHHTEHLYVGSRGPHLDHRAYVLTRQTRYRVSSPLPRFLFYFHHTCALFCDHPLLIYIPKAPVCLTMLGSVNSDVNNLDRKCRWQIYLFISWITYRNN